MRKPIPRALEVSLGAIVAMFGAGLALFAGLGCYRAVQRLHRHGMPLKPGMLAFAFVLIVIALVLFVLAFRLLRGRGANGSPSLMSRPGLGIASVVFGLWVAFVIAACFELRDASGLWLALPGVLMMALSLRQMRIVGRSR